MQNLLGGFRYSLRQFRLSPVFTVTAVLTLALGIGGTTAIFTLIHAVTLRSLPVADPAGLYRIGDGNDCCEESGPQDRWGMFSFPLYQRLKAAAPEFDEVAAFQAGAERLSVRREGSAAAAQSLRSEFVTGNYFHTLGIGALGGRVLTPTDDQASAAPVVVLSHHVWETNYGADPHVLGAIFVIQGHPFTVVGITPAGFYGETLRSDPPEVWIPLQQESLIAGVNSLLRAQTGAWLRVIGRLHPGASVAGIAPRLTGILREWMKSDAGYPSNWMPEIIHSLPRQIINVVPAGSGVAVMKENYGRSLRILLAVCGLVLLIACANVANLLLARAVARRGQTAVRLAVGASRRQIVLQALLESVMLAIGGGIAGLVVAVAAARLLLLLAFRSSHFLPIDIYPSPIVLAFAFTVALLTGIIFGSTPAWFAARTAPAEALRGLNRSTGDHSSLARNTLLIVQATVSVVLIAGATMLARSLDNLEHQNLGYGIKNRVVISLNHPPATYTVPKLNSLYRELETRLDSIPGVRGANFALYNPLTDNWEELILVAGRAAPIVWDNAGASWDRVSAHYLQDFDIRLKRGRYFTKADNENTAPVAIVNEAFAKRFFKDSEDPLSQHFGLDLVANASTFRIVGIVNDAKFAGFALNQQARPMFFVPLAQNVDYKDGNMMKGTELQSHFIGGIMLLTNASPGMLEPLVTRALSDVDPNLTVNSIRAMQQQVDLTFDQERAVAGLASLFGIVALLLAAGGLYGVTAYTVAQRTHEIGIRMALGADRPQVIQLVLRGAFQRVLIGLLLGLPLAVGAGRLIASQLYGISFWDPFALTIASVSLALCAFIAAVIPARRAASISPVTALRVE